MPNSFKPLRRKIGIVTLVAACVFTAAWVRSLFVDDYFDFNNWRQFESPRGQVSGIGAANGAISLYQFDSVVDTTPPPPEIPSALDPENADHVLSYDPVTGTELVAVPLRTLVVSTSTMMEIPYWSIVIPLTLLSVWLLLSKPRVGKTTSLQ